MQPHSVTSANTSSRAAVMNRGTEGASGATPARPHLLQPLPEDLRKRFLYRFLAAAPSPRQAVLQLRGWARICRSHRAEVLALLKETAFRDLSLVATAQVIPVAIGLYWHAGNPAPAVRRAVQELGETHAQIHLALGANVGLLHELTSHCAELGKLLTHEGVQYLRLDLTGALYEGAIFDLFKGARNGLREARKTAFLPQLELRWLHAGPDFPLHVLLDELAAIPALCAQLVRLDLRGFRATPSNENLHPDAAAPILFARLRSVMAQADKLQVAHFARARLGPYLGDLLAALSPAASLRRIDLRQCKLNAAHADQLLEWLQSAPHVRVSLAGNPIPAGHPVWGYHLTHGGQGTC